MITPKLMNRSAWQNEENRFRKDLDYILDPTKFY